MQSFLKELKISELNKGVCTGTKWMSTSGEKIVSSSPVDGKLIATINSCDKRSFDFVVETAQSAFLEWRTWPAPKRGEVVRQIGNELRKNKANLGKLVSYEMGKSLQEGMGEVQEMIDVCDLAVGLSRQLYGLTMHSERPGHRMYEQYHPLGIVGIISAFNFPVAVWSWNSLIAMVCGDVCIWKPSEKTPLCAVACQQIISKVFKENKVPEGVCSLISGAREAGEWLCEEPKVALVSATGSTRMGKAVSAVVGGRLGRALLELGGNNAIIISKEADLNIALIGSMFGAVGTAGQRCTTTRRLIIHEDIYEVFKKKLVNAYKQLKIGDPLKEENHVGPLIDKDAVAAYLDAIEQCKKQGGKFAVAGGTLSGKGFESGCYVKPCIAEVTNDMKIVQHETFAPILYLIKYKTIDEAIALQNDVPQGLSSSIFTLNLREAEAFLSHAGSDCGIANVNIGTSGA
ncbi:MAG: aldehyde dehydrogenase family protein, partial [Ginsengibacter sp.]